MVKKNKTQYEKFLASLTEKEKKEYKEEYKEFLLSEMLLAAMEDDQISVRKLAKAAGVSPSIIQGIRSGTAQNITVKSLVKILHTLGYSLVAEKDGHRLSIDIYRR